MNLAAMNYANLDSLHLDGSNSDAPPGLVRFYSLTGGLRAPANICQPSGLKRAALALLSVLALLLAGCDPQNVVRWSPDGAHAIVSSGDISYFVDGEGKIVGQMPDACYWMSDSRRVAVIHKVKAANWAEVASLIGEERTQSTVRAADEMAGLVRGYQGDWSKFFGSEGFQHWDDLHQNIAATYSTNDMLAGVTNLLLPLFYLREKNAEIVAPLLAALAKDAAKDEKTAEILDMMISELIVRSPLPDRPIPEKLLFRSLDPIALVRPSPNGKEIAVIIDEPVRPGLYVMSAEEGDRVSVDSGAANVDWTPDGQWLIYAKTTLPYAELQNQMLLGTITRCKVCDAQGRILPSAESGMQALLNAKAPGDASGGGRIVPNAEKPEDLAGVLYGKGDNSVACLPDGRILFAGIEIGLPAVTQESGGKLKLFALTPGEKPKIERIIRDEAAAPRWLRLDLFSLSPDGKHVAIPGENGEVAMVTIATGEVREIQGIVFESSDKKLFSNKAENFIAVSPSWRNSTEFSCVIPAGSSGTGPKRAEVVLRSLNGASRVISATWTDEMTDAFLPRPK